MTNWRIGNGSQLYQSTPLRINVSSSASANTKGSWVEVFSSTDFTANFIWILGGWSTGGRNYLIDVAIGSAGNEKVILSNLHYAGSTINASRIGFNFSFPIYIPSGERVSIRCQSTSGSQSIRFNVGISAITFGSRPGYNKVITYGAVTGDSGGTQVDPGGSALTKGSWVQFKDSTEMNIGAIMMSIGNRQNTAPGWEWAYVDIGVGGAGSEVVVIPDIGHHMTYENESRVPGQTPILFCNIPKGSRVALRASSNITDATDRLMDIVLYALCY